MTKNFLKPDAALGVERRVTSSVFRPGRRGIALLLTGLVVFGVLGRSTGEAAPLTEVPGPRFASSTPAAKPPAPAPAAPAAPLDELAYHDGDRVRGRLLKREGDVLVFQSERFGTLRVAATEADVVLGRPPATAAVAAAAAQAAEEDDEGAVDVERAPFSPLAMARALKQFFGSWHGRFAVAAEMMQDGSKHDSGTVEGRLTRKWAADEVQLNGRYDYSIVDELTSTDMVKADGVWRHDLPRDLFGVYRPTLEWNRAFFRNGVPSDYVLLQQEAGVGINLFSSDTRKLRAGVSENLFDVWVVPTQEHVSQNVESVFAEIEAKLPWRIVLTDRGVYYYSFAKNTEGWENRFEVNKKLTETLTVGVRHEIRHNNPDVRSADYRRLRVLFGFDF